MQRGLFFLTGILAALVCLGCAPPGPRVIDMPSQDDVDLVLFDTLLVLPKGPKLFRMETFPSLTSNSLKLEYRVSEKESAELFSAFSGFTDDNLPLPGYPVTKVVPSKINGAEYPWRFGIKKEIQSEGFYLVTIEGLQFYN